MGTRAIIAKPDRGDGWTGRYHHWDGYPTGLGNTLLEWGERKGAAWLVARLVDHDEAKMGWSTINGHDLELAGQWGTSASELRGDKYVPTHSGPESYTVRGEEGEWVFTESDEDYAGAEWLYVITPGGLMVADGAAGAFGVGGGNFRNLKLFPWSHRFTEDAL